MEYHGRLQQFNHMPAISPEEMRSVATSEDFEFTSLLINESCTELEAILSMNQDMASGSLENISVELNELKNFYEFCDAYNKKKLGVLTDNSCFDNNSNIINKPELKPFNPLLDSFISSGDHTENYAELPTPLYYNTDDYNKLPDTLPALKLYSKHIATPLVWRRETIEQTINNLHRLLDHDHVRGNLDALPIATKLNQILSLVESGPIGDILNAPPLASSPHLN